MKKFFTMLMLSGLVFGTPLVFGQDEDDKKPAKKSTVAEGDSVEEQFNKIAKNGPGVYLIERDKKGRITSCIVVGQATISTVLGKPKGLELARKKAELDCSAQFVKWLKEEVKVYSLADSESVIITEGKEGADKELNETGKSIDKLSEKMESTSKGLVRGLQNLHKGTDGVGKTYTIVKGFKADNANGVKKLSKDLASDEPEDKSEIKPSLDKKKKIANDEIETGSVTAPGAEDFLPKKKK